MVVIVVFLLIFQQALSACVQDLCTTDTQVQDEIVNLHNDLRRSVSPPAQDMLQMSWSEEIATALQTWVDGCSLAHGQPSSRMLDDYELGENLYYAASQKSWTTVIKTWYNEVQNYKYPNGSTNGKEVGHYTQVIWNGSYRVGCAMAACPQDDVYFYTCRYFRAGNFRTWPPYTEGPWCGLCPDNCDDKLCTNPCPYINQFLNCPDLKRDYGCSPSVIKENCPASCNCLTEIIPVFRR